MHFSDRVNALAPKPCTVSKSDPGMDDALKLLTDRIAAAPFEPETWPAVLEDMASVLGGWGGQLVAVAEGRFRLYLAGRNVSDDLIQEGVTHGAAAQ